jgi:hypothetical protein
MYETLRGGQKSVTVSASSRTMYIEGTKLEDEFEAWHL